MEFSTIWKSPKKNFCIKELAFFPQYFDLFIRKETVYVKEPFLCKGTYLQKEIGIHKQLQNLWCPNMLAVIPGHIQLKRFILM
jgi:hypothetical protein